MKALLIMALLFAMPTGWGDSESTIGQTVVWLNRNLQFYYYEAALDHRSGHVVLTTNNIEIWSDHNYKFQEMSLAGMSVDSYRDHESLFKANLRELVADAHISDSGNIKLSCVNPCFDVQIDFHDDLAETEETRKTIQFNGFIDSASFQDDPDLGKRIVMALNHLILLSGGEKAVKKDLF